MQAIQCNEIISDEVFLIGLDQKIQKVGFHSWTLYEKILCSETSLRYDYTPV